MPQGPASDSFNIYLFVNVIDDSSGTTVYTIATPVSVWPNNQLETTVVTSISTGDTNNPFLQALNSGNLNLVCKNVIALATVFNIQSSNNPSSYNSSDSSALYSQNNQLADLREFITKKVVDLSVSDMSSIKVISSALSVTTQIPEQINTNTAVK